MAVFPHPGDPGQPGLADHLHAAISGSIEDQVWLIERFTPPLMIAARRRLRQAGTRLCEPEDLVQDVWATVWPRLGEIESPPEVLTPVLLKFLSQTLQNLWLNLARKASVRAKRSGPPPGGVTETDPMARLPDDTSGIVTKTVRREAHAHLLNALDRLEPIDRQVIELRACEQMSTAETAAILQMTPTNVSARYRRALPKLTRLLPESLMAELRAD